MTWGDGHSATGPKHEAPGAEVATEMVERFKASWPTIDFRSIEQRLAARAVATGTWDTWAQASKWKPPVKLKLIWEYLPKSLLDTETRRRQELRAAVKLAWYGRRR